MTFVTVGSSVAFSSVLPLYPNFQGFPPKSRKNGAATTLGPKSVKALNLALRFGVTWAFSFKPFNNNNNNNLIKTSLHT